MMKRNYTLIELLTVIFIIAVLAGLIMPATSMVRSKARRTACASNLKQVGALCMQFSNDRDGQIPMYKAAADYTVRSKNVENYHRKARQTKFEKPDTATDVISTTNDNRKLWTTGLLRYAKYDMSVFFCPSDERELNVFDSASSKDQSSYSLNYGNADRPGGAAGGSYVKVSSVTRSPGGVVLVAETDPGKLGVDSTAASWFSTAFPKKFVRAPNPPHSKELNINFMDGHVETMREPELSILNANKGFQINNN